MIYPIIKVMQDELNQSGLKVSDIDQVIGVTKSIFGLDWLESLASKRKDLPNPFDQHPIIIGSCSGSFVHLIELIELCSYLLSFKNDKEIAKIVPSLKKESSYGDCLFQLAMAYRFKKLDFDVVLEPQISNGLLADFHALRGDLSIMAECTVLREWNIRQKQREIFADCLNKFKKIHKKTNKRFVLDIVSKKSLSSDTLQILRDHIMKVGNDFLNNGVRVDIADEDYEISIYEMDDKISEKVDKDSRHYFKELSLQGWDQILSFSIGKASIPGDVTSVDFSRMRSESIMKHKSLITPEEEFEYSLEDRLDKKMLDKLRQIKEHPKGHLSLLFIEVEDKLENADFNRIGKRISRNIFSKVSTLDGVFIAKRNWTADLKHQYQGTFFSNSDNKFNDSLFLGFNIVERDINFIDEWRSLFNNSK